MIVATALRDLRACKRTCRHDRRCRLRIFLAHDYLRINLETAKSLLVTEFQGLVYQPDSVCRRAE